MTTKTANPKHVVVDGSNIATEGRTMPSLAQLNDAVNSYIADHPGVRVTVVVDATFGHRIADSEVKEFDAAIANNELVAPPAGAIGRGDAFVLSIAKKAKATILSNDSFQEFHGEHEWLFDDDRLVGGKPVPHVGWVWVSRNPVRGPVSRKAVRASKTPSSRNAVADDVITKVDRGPAPKRASARRASKEAAAPVPVQSTPGRSAPPPDAAPSAQTGDVVNELMPFLDFVQHHPVGTSVNAIVDSYSSHGAYVKIGNVFGYVPLRLMSNPPPRSARDVMRVGDAVTLVVASFAPARRGIDCAVPNMASVVEPQDVQAVVAEAAGAVAPSAKRAVGRKAAAKPAKVPAKQPAKPPAKDAAQPPAKAPARDKAPASPTKAAAKKAAPPRAAKRSPTSKAEPSITPNAPVRELVEEPVSEPPAKTTTRSEALPRKMAPRAATKRTSMSSDTVSPAARARRRGPRSTAGSADPSTSPPPPPDPAGAVAQPEAAGTSAPPKSSKPPTRKRAAKKADK